MASVGKRAGRRNEDFAGAGNGLAVVVDGAGLAGTGSVCRHGVAWYAHRLGAALLSLSAGDLPSLLASAISQVTDEHRDTCVVADPISPSAAVALLRVSGDVASYLVLGDATVVLERDGSAPFVVNDPREVVISGRYEGPYAATAEGSPDRADSEGVPHAP